MKSSIATSARVCFHWDSMQFIDAVTEEDDVANWIDISIQVGRQDLFGGEFNNTCGAGVQALRQFLESVEASLHDEHYIIELGYGPTDIVVRPRDEESVDVITDRLHTGGYDDDELLEVDVVAPVTKRAWADAVIDVAEEFVEMVTTMNPDLEGDQLVEEIRDRTERVKIRADEHLDDC